MWLELFAHFSKRLNPVGGNRLTGKITTKNIIFSYTELSKETNNTVEAFYQFFVEHNNDAFHAIGQVVSMVMWKTQKTRPETDSLKSDVKNFNIFY